MSTEFRENFSNDVVVGTVRGRAVSSPVPPLEALEKHERILSGFSERSWAMFEKQTDHRHFLEKQVVSAKLKREAAGQTMALVLTLTAFGIGGAALILHEVSVGFGRRRGA
jgi:uncharacterized membrane protein